VVGRQGGTDANELIAKLSPSGTLCVYTLTAAHVIVDVVGYIFDAPYTAITPTRYADSRNQSTFDSQFRDTGPRAGGTVWEIALEGRPSTPTDAIAAVVNVTVTGAADHGYATVYPCGAMPTASSVNYRPGDTRSNELIAKLSPAGSICIYTLADAHVIVDVVGFLHDSPGYTAITPTRYADSRDQPTFDNQYRDIGRRPAGTVWEVPVAGRGTVPINASSAALNLTVTGASGPGFATAYPCGTVPVASSVNYAPGDTRSNELVTKLSPAGTICVFTLTDVHVIIDVVGYA
jgi:hypothetical protein